MWLSEKLVSFKMIEPVHGEYMITSEQFKGWRMQLTVVMKKVVLTGVNSDGSPILQLTYEVHSTPVPSDDLLEDNR